MRYSIFFSTATAYFSMMAVAAPVAAPVPAPVAAPVPAPEAAPEAAPELEKKSVLEPLIEMRVSVAPQPAYSPCPALPHCPVLTDSVSRMS